MNVRVLKRIISPKNLVCKNNTRNCSRAVPRVRVHVDFFLGHLRVSCGRDAPLPLTTSRCVSIK